MVVVVVTAVVIVVFVVGRHRICGGGVGMVPSPKPNSPDLVNVEGESLSNGRESNEYNGVVLSTSTRHALDRHDTAHLKLIGASVVCGAVRYALPG